MLERRTVKKPQEARYKRIVHLFYLWCVTARVAINNTWQLDSAETFYLHEQFFEGFPSSVGPFLLATLMYCRLGLSAKAPELPRARRALLGFMRTSEFDESLSHDITEFSWVGDLLARLRAGRGATPPLLDLMYATWAAQFTQAAVVAGIGALGPPTLYQLRHRVASHELAAHARPLPEITKRGRWASDSNVRRYEMGGLLPTQLQQSTEAVQ